MPALTEPTRLTDRQKEIADELNLHAATCVLSVIEVATGEQRAVVCWVDRAPDGSCTMHPLAMLLDQDDDMDRFYPGAEAENVG